MIQINKMVPNVYYQHSRDFQFIGRLYELVLNSIKTNSDLLYNLPNNENSDIAFLDLLSTTFGFKTLHNYNVQQLKSLCACFAEVIRNKGNIRSIEKACNALVSAEGITETVYIDNSNPKKGLVLYVPQQLSDISLLRDLMDYVLPAGLTYTIVQTLNVSRNLTTSINVNNDVQIRVRGARNTSYIKDNYNLADIKTPYLDSVAIGINSTITDTSQYEVRAVNEMKVVGKVDPLPLIHGIIYFTYPADESAESSSITGQTITVPDGQIVKCTLEGIPNTFGVKIEGDNTAIYFKKASDTEGQKWHYVGSMANLKDGEYYIESVTETTTRTMWFKMPAEDIEILAEFTLL